MHWLIESYGILVLHALPLLALLCLRSKMRWQTSQVLLTAHLVCSLALLLFALLMDKLTIREGDELFQMNGLSLIVISLISFISLITLRYARQNLISEPNRDHFLFWYLITFLAVGITVTANHLVIFLLAWISISFSLHRLLLFYPERPRAKLAAHKKFLFARVSELLLMSAFIVLYYQHGTFAISSILMEYRSQVSTTGLDQLAALLLVLVALIKCAQLPLHGWLIQVVEAPTPVSALLHAGIINLGGFLLLKFSALLSMAVLAQWVLLIVAGLTTVIATLVMMTRISIKVRLAWSTVAQMGLMLVECALGLYELALLHLLAHSCYKAHAFLGSGEAVNHYLRKQYAGPCLPSLAHWLTATGSVLLVAVLAITFIDLPSLFSPWLLIGIALISLLAFHFSTGSINRATRAVLLSALGIGIYVGGTLLLAPLFLDSARPFSLLADLWIMALLGSLSIVFLLVLYVPHNTTYKRWFIALNAGFYLDEWATRMTLWLSPITLPSIPAATTETQSQR